MLSPSGGEEDTSVCSVLTGDTRTCKHQHSMVMWRVSACHRFWFHTAALDLDCASHLADGDHRKRLAGRVSAGRDPGDHSGLRRRGGQTWGPPLGSTSSARALEGDGALWPTAGAGGRPPSDEGDFHGGVRSTTRAAESSIHNLI